jgi:hypothetical protein
MAAGDDVNVFVSVGAPHLAVQETFLVRLERSLRSRGFRSLTLGRNNYDNRNPLRAIRDLMLRCEGAVIVGFDRRVAPVAIEKQGSVSERRLRNVRTATPWNHLEAGMAFQLDIPMLILKDRATHPEGILDQSVGEYLVFEFDIESESEGLSPPLKRTIETWAAQVRERARREGGKSQLEKICPFGTASTEEGKCSRIDRRGDRGHSGHNGGRPHSLG